jgi:hypothetical protein
MSTQSFIEARNESVGPNRSVRLLPSAPCVLVLPGIVTVAVPVAASPRGSAPAIDATGAAGPSLPLLVPKGPISLDPPGSQRLISLDNLSTFCFSRVGSRQPAYLPHAVAQNAARGSWPTRPGRLNFRGSQITVTDGRKLWGRLVTCSGLVTRFRRLLGGPRDAD